MSVKLSKRILFGSAAGAAAAFGLALATSAGAQTYDANDYGYDTSATVPGITVMARPDLGRSYKGAPIEEITVSRVVDIRDLDLSTGWGQRELSARVRGAAFDACNQLTSEIPQEETLGRFPTQDDAGSCVGNAVDGAMASVPTGNGH